MNVSPKIHPNLFTGGSVSVTTIPAQGCSGVWQHTSHPKLQRLQNPFCGAGPALVTHCWQQIISHLPVQLNTHISQVLCISKMGAASLGGPGSGTLMRLQSSCELRPLKSCLGRRCFRAHWPSSGELSAPPHRPLPGCLHDLMAGQRSSPRVRDPRGSKRGTPRGCNPFETQFQKWHPSPICWHCH